MATDRDRIEQQNTLSAVREAAEAAAGVPKNPLAAREGVQPRPAVTAQPKATPVHPAVAAAAATVAPAAPNVAVAGLSSVQVGVATGGVPVGDGKNLQQVFNEFEADIHARLAKYRKDIGA